MADFVNAQTDAADFAELVNGNGEVTTRYGDNPKKSWGLIQQESQAEIDRLQNLSSAARYGSVQDGLDNTSDGGYFDVISSSVDGFIDAYKNNAGVGEYLKSYPSTEAINQIQLTNLWPDPFFEDAFLRPFINDNDKSYFGTLNAASSASPFNRPYLSYTGSANAQSIRELSQTSLMEGDVVRFRVLADFSTGSGQVTVYYRDSNSSVIGSSAKTLFSSQSGLQDVILDQSTVPANTVKIEVRVNQGGGASVYGVAVSKGTGIPSFTYTPEKPSEGDLTVSQKNLWPDPFFRQLNAGVTHQNGWSFAQTAGLSLPPFLTTSSNSPFSSELVLEMPTGSGQFDSYIDAKGLSLKSGDTLTIVLGVYSAQTLNLAVFGRTVDNSVVGDPSNRSFVFQASGENRELVFNIEIDETFAKTVDFINVRIGNSLTVGSTPIEIYGRGVFVNNTKPFLYDDCYQEDQKAIQEFRSLPWNTQTMRETQMQVSRIKYNSIDSVYSLAIIGDSFTHLRQRYTLPLAERLQNDLGNAGAGWIGFGNPDSGTGNINGSALSDPTVTVSGTVPSSNYATAQSPDICSVILDNSAVQYRVNTIPADSQSLKLLAKKQTGVIEYSVDSGASWAQVDLSTGSDINVSMLTIPSTQFNLWIRYVSGTVELYGLVHKLSTNGALIHKLGATGSSAAQWSAQVTSSAFKQGLSELSPNAVAIMLGTNDQTGSTRPNVFKQYIQTIVDSVREAVPTADILLLSPPDNQRGSNVPMPAYASVMRDIAIRESIAFHDYQQDYGTDPQSYAFGSDRPWFSADMVHPNPDVGGGLPLAERIRKIVYEG